MKLFTGQELPVPKHVLLPYTNQVIFRSTSPCFDNMLTDLMIIKYAKYDIRI